MSLNAQKIGIIHFVGIGGIGMSGLAEILVSLKFKVQGSDLVDNANVQRLRKKGVKVFIGQNEEHVKNAQVVVISSAITGDNPEVSASRIQGIPVLRRVEMLSEIMKLKPSIAVAGTHGKTTTTSIGATVLRSAGLDPTIISGGIINELGTNALLGLGDWTIAEADESDGTFEKLPAQIAVVTNIDPEHLDYYGTFDDLRSAFYRYIQNIPFYGLALLCADHPETRRLARRITDRRVLTYGFSSDADIRITPNDGARQNHKKTLHSCQKSEKSSFVVCGDDHHFGYQNFAVNLSHHAVKTLHNPEISNAYLGDFSLPMAGSHNLLNAAAVIALGLEIGLSPGKINKGLRDFKGVQRRFTHVGTRNGLHIIDDYAHHPAEIRTTLIAARNITKGRVFAIVQPHRYSRLKTLFDDYVACLSHNQEVFVLPVYAAGEKPDEFYNHIKLVEALQQQGCKAQAVTSLDDLQEKLDHVAKKGDLAIFMGAGDITKWARSYGDLSQVGMPSLGSVRGIYEQEEDSFLMKRSSGGKTYS